MVVGLVFSGGVFCWCLHVFLFFVLDCWVFWLGFCKVVFVLGRVFWFGVFFLGYCEEGFFLSMNPHMT